MAKATKKQVLGRGLTSILKDSKNKASSISKIKTNSSTEIEISKIILNPFQPRSAFNKEKLEDLNLHVMIEIDTFSLEIAYRTPNFRLHNKKYLLFHFLCSVLSDQIISAIYTLASLS